MSKISVIIPVYNAEETIERCILSVTKGSYQDIEVIVVNDGSTDRTSEIIDCLARDDERIKVFNQENKGVSGARDNGLKQATGEYIAWCDSDDWYEADCLSMQHKMITQYNADMVICRARIPGIDDEYDPNEIHIWNRDEAIEAFFEHKLLNGVLTTKIIKRELFDGLSFDTSIRFWEDLDIIWKIISRAKRIVRYNKIEYNLVAHSDSLCASKYSENRAFASLKVLNSIVNDCENTKYYNSACIRRYVWFFGEMRLMFRDDYRDSEYLMNMQKIMKQTGKLGRKPIRGFFRVYAIICENSLTLARLIYKMK